MSILINLLLAFNVIVSLLIVLLVLMQRPKSEGLGAAFGGGMTENLFGAQTTNVLANATRWLGGIFFLLTLLLSILTSHQSAARKSAIGQQLANAPKPAVVAKPAVSGSSAAPEAVANGSKKAAPAIEKSAPAPTAAPAPSASAPVAPAPSAAAPAATGK